MAMSYKLLKVGYEYIPLNELEQYRAVLPISIVAKIGAAIINGESVIAVSSVQLAKWRAKMEQYRQQQALLAQCVELNNKGVDCENYGDLTGAIQAYEQNIALGYPAHHAFKRLLVLYRKAKDYKNELRIAQCACRVFPKDESYKARREKIRELVRKHQ